MHTLGLLGLLFVAMAFGGCPCNSGGQSTRDAAPTDGGMDVAVSTDGGTDVAGPTDVGMDVAIPTDVGMDVAGDTGLEVAPCTGGGACTTNPGAPCTLGVIACSSGQPMCVNSAAVADGTVCGGGICLRGACAANTTVGTNVDLSTAAVTPGRTCAESPLVSVATLTAMAATLSASTDCIAAGDEVLLINLQGAPNAVANVGNWELLTVATITGSQVNFAAAKTKSYGATAGSDAGIGTGATDQKVALVRVAQFGTLTVGAGGTLTSALWNGLAGGVVALRAHSLTVAGTISAAGLGYRSGKWSRDDNCTKSVATEAGESISGLGAAGTANNVGGAGGVSADSGGSFYADTPLQSGAGHAQLGGTGSNGKSRTVGAPGTAYGANDASKLTMGSGSGGNLTCETGFGSPELVLREDRLAGGIVLLLAQQLQIDAGAAITASAKTASRDVSSAGGYVFIRGGTLALGTGQITAVGGTGTSVDGPSMGMSVKAGDGYVVVQGTTVTGTTTPAANRL